MANDTYQEHELHEVYDPNCSTCHKNKPFCEICNDTGRIEVMGDGPNFECDVVGYKSCICTYD